MDTHLIDASLLFHTDQLHEARSALKLKRKPSASHKIQRFIKMDHGWSPIWAI
jgi:hypothetical protein